MQLCCPITATEEGLLLVQGGKNDKHAQHCLMCSQMLAHSTRAAT